jgi:WD40 repeat protein
LIVGTSTVHAVRRLSLVLLAAFVVSTPAQDRAAPVLSVGHPGAPSRATFAGNLFITIAGANAHVIDLVTGLTIARLPQDGLALAVEASPDGGRLAVATCGHTILVWDLRELRLLHRLQTRSECADSVAWSPDGALLAADAYGCCRGVSASVQLWDARTGQLAREIDAAWKARNVVFAGNGAWLAAIDDDGMAHILEWPSGRELRTFTGLESAGGSGSSALASSDGRYFGWIDGGSILVWDVSTGARVPLPGAIESTIMDSPPGRLTSISRQTSVPARNGRFLDDGRLAYVDWETLVTIRLPDGAVDARPLPRAPVDWTGDIGVSAQQDWLAIRRDGAFVGGHVDSRVMAWKPATQRTKRPIAPPVVGPRSLTWSARDIVAWGDLGSAPRGWDAQQGRLVRLATGVESSEQLAFSQDGRTLAVSGMSGTHVIDAARRRVEASVEATDASALAFDPSGRRLAFFDAEGLGLFDLRLRLQRRVDGSADVEHLAWSPDGHWLAASTTGGTSRVRVWRADGALPPRTLHEWRFHESAPLAFSPDGRRLAAVVRGRDVTFWSTSTWAMTGTWQLPVTTRGLAFSPTGQQVAVAGWGESSVWNVDSGARAFTLDTGGSRTVEEVAWSPDGRHLVTAGDDGVLVFWNAATGRVAGSLFVLEGQDEWLFVTPDGRMDGSRRALDTLVAWRTATGIAVDARATRRARVDGLWRAVAGAPSGAPPR